MTNEVFGRSISGDVNPVGSLPEQAPASEFLDALDSILAIPGVESVRWEQFTPYFNDGEPCVFSTGEARVRISGEDEEHGEYGDGFLTEWDTYDYGPGGWADKKYKTFSAHNLYGEDLSKALVDFTRSGLGKKHYVFLGETFGDHAVVTATVDGFEVEYYEHD